MRRESLKRLRLSIPLTLTYCAEGMHISRQTLGNLESGRVQCEATMQHYELYLKDVKRQRQYAAERRANGRASA